MQIIEDFFNYLTLKKMLQRQGKQTVKKAGPHQWAYRN